MSFTPEQSQSLDDWLFYLEQQHPTEIDLGLTRVASVANKAGVDKLNAKQTVLVAGTNGKGTTIRFIEMMLLSLGFKVGVFSSPHLFKYNERVRINGKTLPDKLHVESFKYIHQFKDTVSLTYFEFSTLSAYKLFNDAQLDVVLVEVGLGGRLDSTNIIQQDISVVTSIGLDHMDWLGDTLEQIAFEKAGIFKANNIAVIGETKALKSFDEQAQNHQVARLVKAQQDFNYQEHEERWHYQYAGKQLNDLVRNNVPTQNLATALTTLIELGIELNTEFVNNIITSFNLPGRMQILATSPIKMVDVAHNAHAVSFLKSSLQTREQFAKTKAKHAVVAMMKDKDIESALSPLIDVIEHWYIGALPGNKRAASPDHIAQILTQLGAKHVSVFDSVKSAWQQAEQNLSSSDLLLGFGSFYTVTEVLQLTEIEKDI